MVGQGILGYSNRSSAMQQDAIASKSAKKTTKTYTYKQDSSGNVSTEVHTHVDNVSATNEQTIKTLTEKVRILVDDLDMEQSIRKKSEKERHDMQIQIINLSERLTEAESSSETQIDINRRREAEMTKLRKLLEDTHIQSEQTIHEIKKKHQQVAVEMQEQIDELSKSKERVNKEKSRFQVEIQELLAHIEVLSSEKVSINKSIERLEIEIKENNIKINNMSRASSGFEVKNAELTNHNADLKRSVNEMKQSLDLVNVEKHKTSIQIKELNNTIDLLVRERANQDSVIQSVKNEVKLVSNECEELKYTNGQLGKQCDTFKNDSHNWKQKYEEECRLRIEEVESLKKKLNAHIHNLQSELDSILPRLKNAESKNVKLQEEISLLLRDLETISQNLKQSNAKLATSEKERLIVIDNLRETTVAWEKSDKESKAKSQEILRLSNDLDKYKIDRDSLAKHNAALSDEIKMLKRDIESLNVQLNQVGIERSKAVHERDGLGKNLKDCEAALSDAKRKISELESKLQSVVNDAQNKLTMKENEFNKIKNKLLVEIESLTSRLSDSETKLKSDVERMKKKMEVTVNELQVSLDVVKSNNMKLQATCKEQHDNIQFLTNSNESLNMKLSDSVSSAKSSLMQVEKCTIEIKKLEILVENLTRDKTMAEKNYNDVSSKFVSVMNTNKNLESVRVKLEKELVSISADYDDIAKELKLADERANKATSDANHYDVLLKENKTKLFKLEEINKHLDSNVRSLTVKIEEVESAAYHTSNVTIKKMETRIIELEEILKREKTLHIEAVTNTHKKERTIRDLLLQSEEDRKNILILQESLDKLNEKIKMYKRQLEEQEGLSNSNILRVKKYQRELESAEGRALDAESSLDSLRSRHRIFSNAAEMHRQERQSSVEHVERDVIIKRTVNNVNITQGHDESSAASGMESTGGRNVRAGSLMSVAAGGGENNTSSYLQQSSATSSANRSYSRAASVARTSLMSRASSINATGCRSTPFRRY